MPRNDTCINWQTRLPRTIISDRPFLLAVSTIDTRRRSHFQEATCPPYRITTRAKISRKTATCSVIFAFGEKKAAREDAFLASAMRLGFIDGQNTTRDNRAKLSPRSIDVSIFLSHRNGLKRFTAFAVVAPCRETNVSDDSDGFDILYSSTEISNSKGFAIRKRPTDVILKSEAINDWPDFLKAFQEQLFNQYTPCTRALFKWSIRGPGKHLSLELPDTRCALYTDIYHRFDSRWNFLISLALVPFAQHSSVLISTRIILQPTFPRVAGARFFTPITSSTLTQFTNSWNAERNAEGNPIG